MHFLLAISHCIPSWHKEEAMNISNCTLFIFETKNILITLAITSNAFTSGMKEKQISNAHFLKHGWKSSVKFVLKYSKNWIKYSSWRSKSFLSQIILVQIYFLRQQTSVFSKPTNSKLMSNLQRCTKYFQHLKFSLRINVHKVFNFSSD